MVYVHGCVSHWLSSVYIILNCVFSIYSTWLNHYWLFGWTLNQPPYSRQWQFSQTESWWIKLELDCYRPDISTDQLIRNSSSINRWVNTGITHTCLTCGIPVPPWSNLYSLLSYSSCGCRVFTGSILTATSYHSIVKRQTKCHFIQAIICRITL